MLGDTEACIEWDKCRTAAGYGRCRKDGRYWLVHRLTWTEAFGDIPPGAEIHHTCENKACYNIRHLECVDPTEHRKHHGARGACLSHAEQTRCIRGHEFDKTYIDKQGRSLRRCSICHNERNRVYKAKLTERCANGHEFDRRYVDKNGRVVRGCSICRGSVARERAIDRWSKC